MAEIYVRTAGAADIPLIRDLARRIWTVSYRELLSPAQIAYMLEWMYSPEAIRRDLTAGIRYDLLLLDSQPIGYQAYGGDGERVWKLHKLYLLPEHQGRGFAQQAIRCLGVVAAARGAGRLTLNVNKRNARALRAYERAGFRIVDSVVNDIGGGFAMDDFVLSLDLPLHDAG